MAGVPIGLTLTEASDGVQALAITVGAAALAVGTWFGIRTARGSKRSPERKTEVDLGARPTPSPAAATKERSYAG